MSIAWPPSASLEVLKVRAHILQQIRQFFHTRGVMEVETPLMCHTSVTDPFIQSIPTLVKASPHAEELTYYLQTSPEYAMKRLLVAGSGCIFQLSKTFRQEEVGRYHNPEFTMLEWYRMGFDHHQLMDEMDALLQLILACPPAVRLTYQDLFLQTLNIDPFSATVQELQACSRREGIHFDAVDTDKDTWLSLLMTHCIEPKIGMDRPYMIYHFPASQAALARIQPSSPPVASRFEVYCQGMELANGFHELQDAEEQRKRFLHNLQEREKLGLSPLPLDEFFLTALAQGLPDCAGVALGVDRLVMLATKQTDIKKVISFDFSRA